MLLFISPIGMDVQSAYLPIEKPKDDSQTQLVHGKLLYVALIYSSAPEWIET